MWGCDPRSLLLRAVLLDWLGQLLILLVIVVAPDALSAVPTGSFGDLCRASFGSQSRGSD